MRISDWSSDVCSSDLPVGHDVFDDSVSAGDGDDGVPAGHDRTGRHLLWREPDAERMCRTRSQSKMLACARYLPCRGAKWPMQGYGTHVQVPDSEHAADGCRSQARRGGKECDREGKSGWWT